MNDLINAAYDIIGNLTPLKSDCGILCDAACCKGSDTQGMLLFPYEDISGNITECESGKLYVCNGNCQRKFRPLACRIFPFFPYIHKNGRISAEIDARATRICPLSLHCDEIKFNKDFITAVRKVGRLLSRDPETLKFLKEHSREIDTFKSLYGLNFRYSKRK